MGWRLHGRCGDRDYPAGMARSPVSGADSRFDYFEDSAVHYFGRDRACHDARGLWPEPAKSPVLPGFAWLPGVEIGPRRNAARFRHDAWDAPHRRPIPPRRGYAVAGRSRICAARLFAVDHGALDAGDCNEQHVAAHAVIGTGHGIYL